MCGNIHFLVYSDGNIGNYSPLATIRLSSNLGMQQCVTHTCTCIEFILVPTYNCSCVEMLVVDSHLHLGYNNGYTRPTIRREGEGTAAC